MKPPQDMTEQELDLCIAEIMGAECYFRATVIGPELVLTVRPETPTWIKYRVRNPEEQFSTHTLPPYSTSLDAMAEAEGTLGDRLGDYIDNLRYLIRMTPYPCVFPELATAKQRAQAFIQTHRKDNEK